MLAAVPAHAAPHVAIAPASGPAGTRVVLHGRGCPHRARVAIRAGSAHVVRARAGRHGAFRARVRIAAAARGRVAIVARARRARAVGHFRVTTTTRAQPRFPIRAAFYYPWFPEAWRQQGLDPFTHFTPSAGFYSEDETTTIRRQIAAMRYGRIDAGIASWWGRGSRSDRRIASLLAAAHGTPFRWALYYEPEGQGDPSPAAIRADLAYIRDRYASDPAYLRVNGRFVVFVYADANDGAAMADRWKAANDTGAYVVLKVFSGYRQVASQPDAWHQYAPARAEDSQPGQSFAVSPGFWHAREAAPRLERSVGRFAGSVRAMIASGAPWQLVTTFNEWGEGTAVEPAAEWSSPSGYGAYLDVLHTDGAGATAAP